MIDFDNRTEIVDALKANDINRARALITQWVRSRFSRLTEDRQERLIDLTLKRAIELAKENQ